MQRCEKKEGKTLGHLTLRIKLYSFNPAVFELLISAEAHRRRHFFRVRWRVDGLGVVLSGFVQDGQNSCYSWWRPGWCQCLSDHIHILLYDPNAIIAFNLNLLCVCVCVEQGSSQWGVRAALPSADQRVPGLTASLRPAARTERRDTGCWDGGQGTSVDNLKLNYHQRATKKHHMSHIRCTRQQLSYG